MHQLSFLPPEKKLDANILAAKVDEILTRSQPESPASK
jgi:hypothetical protein